MHATLATAALRPVLTRAARALAFLLDVSELQQHIDGSVRVRASASRCPALPLGPAIDTVTAACAFLVAPQRALTAAHVVCHRDPRALRLLFAHQHGPELAADGHWFRFAPEHVATVDHIEYLDLRRGSADVALLRLRSRTKALHAEPAPLTVLMADTAAAHIGMVAHPYGLPAQFIHADQHGAPARLLASNSQMGVARMAAWRGCSGAPWCTAQGVIGVQVRREGELAHAHIGLAELPCLR